MATTTNFGWTTPDDTDLVKDGAAAIRTLGSAIDTSLVDLKGGTTGQILSKTSNTDLDYTWINNDQGDITEVVAGTGLSGGGSTGSVTLSLSSPVSETNGGTGQTTYATGDIIYASAANTLAKKAIGTTGQVLTVSGGVPAWATLSAGGVKQVVTFTTTTNTATTNTQVDTALSASITPTSASSKILVIFSLPYCGFTTSSTAGDSFDITWYANANGSNFNKARTGGYKILPTTTNVKEMMYCVNFISVHSPATTSAVTYKLRFETNSGQATANTNQAGGASTMLLTLIEV